MASGYLHKILVVDDDEQIKKIIKGLVQREKLEIVFTDHGESGLELIKNTKTPFSIIISEQNIKSGIKGTRFLAQTKKITPDSIRILMTACSEMETIIEAVNKGAIQKYIAKPWEPDDFLSAVKSGLNSYEGFLDNENLLNLAKQQNAKLYELNCEFMEITKRLNKDIHDLDADIGILEKKMKDFSSLPPAGHNSLLDEMEKSVKDDQGIDPEKAGILFSNTIKRIYDQLNASARQSGCKIPDMESEIE